MTNTPDAYGVSGWERKMAAKARQQTETAIKAIKGFDADWRCRGYQYEVGKTFTVSGSVVCCGSGFHACDGSPFDVWGYYGPVGKDGRLNRFADVTMGGKTSREDGGKDSKLASAKITIDAEITLPAFIKRAVAWVIDATKGKGDNPSGHYAQIGSSGHSAQIGSSGDYARIGSSGDYARIGSSGDYAQIGSSGDYAQIGSSGHYARIGSSGDYARIGSSGDSAQIGSSGHYARIGSSGHYARIGSSGDYARIGSSGDSAQIGSSGDSARIGSSGDSAQIGSSGDYAQIGSSGDYAQIVAEGSNAVVACAGSATVTVGSGGAICIPYHDGKRTRFAIGYVGEDGIEAGVAYTVKNGKLVAA
jgi:hypothetical protein